MDDREFESEGELEGMRNELSIFKSDAPGKSTDAAESDFGTLGALVVSNSRSVRRVSTFDRGGGSKRGRGYHSKLV